MDVDVMLCDHAEVAEGKLFVNGAAINLLWVGAEPPHVVGFSVAVIVQVPYTETNQVHTINLRLVDEDGHPTAPWAPPGAPESPPVEMRGEFNVGRPPVLPPGEAQTVPFAFNLQGLRLGRLGIYSVRVEVDDVAVRQLPFRLVVHQQ